MKKNMGLDDRTLRIMAAALFIVLYLQGSVGGTLGILLLIFAGIFIVTAVIGFCPLYTPFRINTNEEK